VTETDFLGFLPLITCCPLLVDVPSVLDPFCLLYLFESVVNLFAEITLLFPDFLCFLYSVGFGVVLLATFRLLCPGFCGMVFLVLAAQRCAATNIILLFLSNTLRYLNGTSMSQCSKHLYFYEYKYIRLHKISISKSP